MLLKNELRFLFSKRNILVLILVLSGVLSVYFFKYNTEYEQYASNQIMYYYEMINEENQRIRTEEREKRIAERNQRLADYAPYRKLGRNDKCLCGSDKKYKKCCQRCYRPQN